MTIREQIPEEIATLPEAYIEEILDFIRFLKEKLMKDKIAASVLSESSLDKDWLSPEEDEAWRHL